MNKQQEPRLRFKGFTGAWEKKVLGEILSVRNEFVDSSLYDLDVELENLISNSGILVGDTSVRTQTTSLFRKGDILFGRLRPYLNKWWFAEKDGVKSGEIWALETSSKYSNSFAYLLVQSRKFLEIANVTSGTKMPRADWRSLTAITFNSPSKLEQTHLGNFFRCLDSQIAESRAVLEKSRQLKKAMLAKMFPANGEKIPKIRFKGFEGEWESRKLGEVVEIVGGYAFKSAEFGSGNMAIIRISNILPNGSIGGDFVYFGEDENLEKFKANKNDYLIAMSGATTGKIGQVRHEAYINQRVGLFRQNENSNNDFIGSLLQKEEFLTYLMENWGAGAQPNISIKQMENYNTYFPNLKEQTAIGLFFRQLDETIALQSAEVEKLNQLKKGLLAAMLV